MASTLIDIFEERVNQSGAAIALRGTAMPNGLTWSEWFSASERLAAGLIEWGVRPGDRIALLSQTRPDWVLLDIAIMMCGAVTVPLYPASLASAYAEIFRDARPTLVIVEDPEQLHKLVEGGVPLRRVAYLDEETVFRKPHNGRLQLHVSDVNCDGVELRSVAEIDAAGRRRLVIEPAVVSARRRQITPTDTASIVYTSGTSGEPLGVVLTHGNFVAEIESLTSLKILSPRDAQLLFLPLAHIFARVLYLTAVGYGIETTFVSELHRLKEYWQTFRPTFFAAVPHILEKIQDQMVTESQRSEWRGTALQLSQDVHQLEAGRFAKVARLLRRHVVDPWVAAPVRDLFGGRLRFMISGGAPLPRSVGEFFASLGVQVLEGYGLTEVTGVATVNLPNEHRLGSVGRPLPGVEVTIDEDGEILVRGRNVMVGYHGRTAHSSAALTSNGWCRTGDLGEYDRAGFLHITGRKKDLIVTSGGKNIAPSPLEMALRSHPLISSAVVFGDERPYLVALLSVAQDEVEAWKKLHGGQDPRDEIHRHVLSVNARLAPFEAVRRYDFIDTPTLGDELTPTNKLKRRVVLEKYHEKIAALYQREAGRGSLETA